MTETYTPRQLLARCRELRAEMPISDMIPTPKCYNSHRHHWEGWLRDYCEGRAYYGRKNFDVDAATIYQRIQNVGMIVWLAEAAGVSPNTVRHAALRAANTPGNVARQSAAARQLLPWAMVAKALWPAK